MSGSKLTIGIDEAGRGPLAGPVSVGAFVSEEKVGEWIMKNIFQNKLRDSKKLSPKKREEIYKKLCELQKADKLSFSVSHISNKIIDKFSISYAIKLGIKNCLKKLPHPQPLPLQRGGEKELSIRLDGSLKAPAEYKNQETIIGGDAKNVYIACASIVAKVQRDRLMCRLASKYPLYELQIHKGYGTKLHISLIRKYGISDLHRKSFCKNLTK